MLSKDQLISDLKQSVAQLDGNMDELQSELDNKTEELCEAKQQLERQCHDFSNVQHQMSVAASTQDNLNRKMYDFQTEIKHLKSEIASLREQLDQQTTLAQLKSQEVAELTEDLKTLT